MRLKVVLRADNDDAGRQQEANVTKKGAKVQLWCGCRCEVVEMVGLRVLNCELSG